MRSIFLVPLLSLLLFSCSEPTESAVEQVTAPYDEPEHGKVTFPDSVHYLAEKLPGTWKDSKDTLNCYAEYWHYKNDSILAADSYQYDEGNVVLK